jgi:molybdate transport system substrate-binding protein
MRLRLAAVLAAVALVAAGAAQARRDAQITVLAAASLVDVLPRIDSTPRYSFAGSNQLAAQVVQGAPADVFASANTSLPADLYAKGLVEKPVVFTSNRLVLVVPSANPAGIRSVFDLKRPGTKLVVGTGTVPVGSYTRTVLKNMGLSASVLPNVVSEESDVRGVLAKVALGEADAGFVYATDALTVKGKVAVLRIPAWAQPRVRYAVAVVTGSQNRAAARAFVQRLLSKQGQAKLLAAGFGAAAAPS